MTLAISSRPEVGGEVPAHFPEGRRRLIQWVIRFGAMRLARELKMPEASGRSTIGAWTNRSTSTLVPPSLKYAQQIVMLSREFRCGMAPLTLDDIYEGTEGMRGFFPEEKQAFRFIAPGVRVDLLNLDMELVTIEIVANLLAHTPRYAGAAGLYSVAQHCCLGTEWILEQAPMSAGHSSFLRRKRAFDFLNHDDHEALIQDIISPVARALIGERYRIRKREIDKQMARHFGYRSMENNEPGSEYARRIDQAMLSTEEMHFFGEVSTAATPLPIEIEVWDPQTSYLRFLDLFHHLKPAQEVAA